MSRVVTIGNAMVDVVAAVPHLPHRGGDVLATAGGLVVGGGGFRAIAAARAEGVAAVYGGRIGTGPFGDLVRAELRRLGIPAPLPAVPDRDTGFVLTWTEPDGERTFTTVTGAEQAPPEAEGIGLRRDDVVHVHGYGLGAARGAAVADALLGLPDSAVVALDPGPFGADAEPEVLGRLLPRVDWWSGNDAEARAATGLGDPEAAARLLSATVRRGTIVRMGADGCLLAERGSSPLHLTAPTVVARDTNGAGDTHVGVFLAAVARGSAPSEAAKAANAAAARFVAGTRDRNGDAGRTRVSWSG